MPRLLSVILSLLFVGAFITSRTVLGQAASPSTIALLDTLRPMVESALTRADWVTLEAAIRRLRAASASESGRNDPWLHYDLAYALHRRGSALLVEERTREARALLQESATVATRAKDLGAGAHALALAGTVTGQLAGVSGTLAAIPLGPRAFRLLDQALDAAPDDPRVALLNGITRLNAPRAFGGGAAKGEPEFRRALRLFESESRAPPRPEWGYADAHIWLGIALGQLGRPNEARAEYQRALERAPGHRWIIDELLPALDRGR